MSPENVVEGGPEDTRPESAGLGGTTLRSLEETLQELVRGTTEVVRRGREARQQLDETTRDLERLRAQRRDLQAEIEELERCRASLQAELESERNSAAAHLEQMRALAQDEVAQSRRTKEQVESEIRGLEERRAEVTRQIGTFLKDQLTVLRRMDTQAKSIASSLRPPPQQDETAGGSASGAMPKKPGERPPDNGVRPARADAVDVARPSRVTIVATGFRDVESLMSFQRAVQQLSSIAGIETREFRDGALYLIVTARDRRRLEAEVGQLPGVPVSTVSARHDEIYVEISPESRPQS